MSSFAEYIAAANLAGQRRPRARLAAAAGAVARKARTTAPTVRAASFRAIRQPEPRPSRRAARADFSHLEGKSLEGWADRPEEAGPWNRYMAAAREGGSLAAGNPVVQASWDTAFIKAGIDFAPTPRRTATLRGPTGRLIPVSYR